MNFFNPFGPYILHSEIDEESRKISLDLILQLDKDIKDGTIKSEGNIIAGVDGLDYEKNSISNGTMRRIPSDFNSSIIGNIINYFTIDYFKQLEILNPFCDDSGTLFKQKEYTDCKTNESCIIDAWYVMMEEGDFHIIHNHTYSSLIINDKKIDLSATAIVSGAIYLDIPEDIKTPQGDLNFILNSHDVPLHNSHWFITPKSGDVYVWPGWLKHFVYPFKSKEKRIMVSFNSIWKKIDPKDGTVEY